MAGSRGWRRRLSGRKVYRCCVCGQGWVMRLCAVGWDACVHDILRSGALQGVQVLIQSDWQELGRFAAF